MAHRGVADLPAAGRAVAAKPSLWEMRRSYPEGMPSVKTVEVEEVEVEKRSGNT